MRKRPPIAWILLGLVLGIAVAYAWLIHEPSELLTAEGLRAAQMRWSESGPRSYDLVVTISGSVAANHRIEVRDGEVKRMMTGEQEAARSAWEYWSVDGLFEFLGTELTNAEQSAKAYGVPPGNVVLRARFHDQLGHPEFFLRHVLGKGMAVEWRVEEFAAIGG